MRRIRKRRRLCAPSISGELSCQFWFFSSYIVHFCVENREEPVAVVLVLEEKRGQGREGGEIVEEEEEEEDKVGE